MKSYVHARLNPEEQKILKEIKKATGETESSIVKKGLRLVYSQKVKKVRSALEVAGDSVGKFRGTIRDLATNKKYFEGFGQ